MSSAVKMAILQWVRMMQSLEYFQKESSVSLKLVATFIITPIYIEKNRTAFWSLSQFKCVHVHCTFYMKEYM